MENMAQTLISERLGGVNFGKDTTIYKFEKIKLACRAAVKANPDKELIDLGVGEPDWMADPKVVDVLCQEARKWENRGYSDNGVPEFKQAAAKYMKTVYGVDGLDPDTEINHGIGSKSILALLPAAFINPGDIAIVTVPGYPVLGTATGVLGGKVINLALHEENSFLPDLNQLTEDQKQKAKLLYINYPNNPTGSVATEAFYAGIIAFARENNVLVVSDEAYGALVFDGKKPLSFLNMAGAKEVGVVIQSLSKAFNMTGWRLAFIAGNETAVKAFATIKDNNDSGQFKAIQMAGAYCFAHPEITERTIAKYSRRLDLLVDVLSSAGFQVKRPGGSFYLYLKAPIATETGVQFETAEDFSQYLIKEKMISTVPWDDAGAYIRLSLTFIAKDEDDEIRIAQELKRRLGRSEFVFA